MEDLVTKFIDQIQNSKLEHNLRSKLRTAYWSSQYFKDKISLVFRDFQRLDFDRRAKENFLRSVF